MSQVRIGPFEGAPKDVRIGPFEGAPKDVRIGEFDTRDERFSDERFRGWKLLLLMAANLAVVVVPLAIAASLAGQWQAQPSMALYDRQGVCLKLAHLLVLATAPVMLLDIYQGGVATRDRMGPWMLLALMELFVYVAILCGAYGQRQAMEQDVARAYDVSGVESVAVDTGRATDSRVRFRTGDGTEFEMPASVLGYTDVVSDDGIQAPEDRLETDSKTLAVPHSYLTDK